MSVRVTGRWPRMQVVWVCAAVLGLAASAAADPGKGPATAPAAQPPMSAIDIPAANAADAAGMKPYAEQIPGTGVKFEMLPIPGGTFLMGSPKSEADHKSDESPQHEVRIAPLWMGKCEVTWDEFELWSMGLDAQRRKLKNADLTPSDKLADAVVRPTKPYSDMTFGMGKEGYPAVCMTQLAAKVYCKWLSAKTGRYYRLPTEAEWEYACRAGTKTAYSFGDDASKLGDYAWYFDNSKEKYHKVGQKKPNPWGLCDMHGNAAEWTLDQYAGDGYARFRGKPADNPLVPGASEYGRVVRGGSWDDDAQKLRSAARQFSVKDWKMQDPQIPQSILVFNRRRFRRFPRRPAVADADAGGGEAIRPRSRAIGRDEQLRKGARRQAVRLEEVVRIMNEAYNAPVKG